MKAICKYLSEKNMMVVTILKPYYTIGTKLGWSTKVGIGIDSQIIRKMIQRNAVLCCYLIEWESTLWLTCADLKKFMSNRYDGKNGTKDIIYIPRVIFTDKKET